MGPFWAAIVGALIGAIGTGAVTWIIQKRAWEHESEVRQKERRLSVMPYVTFSIRENPTKGVSVEGKTTFIRFPRVIARNEGLGPATFTPFDVIASFKDAVQRCPVPERGLIPEGLPVHLPAGGSCEIALAVKDLDGLDAPNGTMQEFAFSDMYGNRYSSELRVYRIMNAQGVSKWLISSAFPRAVNASHTPERHNANSVVTDPQEDSSPRRVGGFRPKTLWRLWRGEYEYDWAPPLYVGGAVLLFLMLVGIFGASALLLWFAGLISAFLGLVGSALLFWGKPPASPGKDRNGQLLNALADDGPIGVERMQQLERRSRWGFALIAYSFVVELGRLLFLRP